MRLNLPLIIPTPQTPVRPASPAPYPILPLPVRERGLFVLPGEVEDGPGERGKLEERILSALFRRYSRMHHDQVVLLDIPDDHFFYAHEYTQYLIARRDVRVILRPAFFRLDLFREPPDIGIGARAAALVRLRDDTFELHDVWATTSLYKTTRRLDRRTGNLVTRRKIHQECVQELALKVFIARQEGIPISGAGIIHLSGQMVYEEGDPAGFFKFNELTRLVEDAIPRARRSIERTQESYRKVVAKSAEGVAVAEREALTPVSRLYQYGLAKLSLDDLKIQYIEDIPPESPFLNPIQRRQVIALKEKRVVVEDTDGLKGTLQGILAKGGQISFFDMEGITPTTAILRGTRNGQGLGLQFSCHHIDGEGRLIHEQFTFDGDPRAPHAGEKLDRDIAAAILKAVGPSGPIIVYNVGHEKRRIRELARRLSQVGERDLAHQLDQFTGDALLKDLVSDMGRRGFGNFARQLAQMIGDDELVRRYVHWLRKSADTAEETRQSEIRGVADEIERALGQTRFIDLLDVIRSHVYHPGLEDAFTLKSVLKAFYPERSHELLEIQNGRGAVRAWEEMLHPETQPERKAQLRLQLLNYCARDTLAEALLLEKLFELVGLPWPFLTNT